LGPPEKAFYEAQKGMPFYLDEKLPNQNVPEEMMNYMLSRHKI
jgi:hypothetical protein